MNRFTLLVLGCLSLILWMAEMGVPDTYINALGERIYRSSIEWITWIGFFAGILELLEVRKNARHRRLLGEVAGVALFIVGIVALLSNAPLWMTVGNLSLSVLFFATAFLMPKHQEDQIIHI